MMISMIAAMAHNRVIGIHNRLPWHLPADFRHFKAVTMGKPVVMGRRTYESIGRPLPGRINVVISRNPDLQIEGCIIAASLDDAIARLQGHEELMIIGGASFYEQVLPRADRLYLTLVDADVDGDAFFPEYHRDQWREVSREAHAADDRNPYRYSFVTLDRVR